MEQENHILIRKIMNTQKQFPKHLVSLLDWSSEQIADLLNLAHVMKKEAKCGKLKRDLDRRTLALIFEKSSMRTRVSFEVGITQLGGACIYLSQKDINLGEREPVKDGARVFSRYVDIVAARVFDHSTVEILAEHSSIPVINALSDKYHPCQALADMMTIQEKFLTTRATVVYIGDANNVARSLAVICAKLGYPFRIASPSNYSFTKDFLGKLQDTAEGSGSGIECFNSPVEASKGADVLYTDTWVSMGQEAEEADRKNVFAPYRIDSRLQSVAGENHIVMHCLPASRGEEITDEAIESRNSVVFDQAENRLHAQRILMRELLKQHQKIQ